MEHQNHLDLTGNFPRRRADMRENQVSAVAFIEQHPNTLVILEAPTGTGKTDIGVAYLQAREKATSSGTCVYVAPTKTLVDQVQRMHPQFTAMYGRSEHDCLYYPGEQLKADQIPCLQLVDCPHRVDQETGETMESGVTPCPYYQAKFKARRSRLVVCTTAFFFFSQWYQKLWDKVNGIVLDEAHNVARSIRQCLSFDITDYQLSRALVLLEQIKAEEERAALQRFLNRMIYLIKRTPPHQPTLLADEEVEQLISILQEIDAKGLSQKIGMAVQSGQIDPKKDREVLLRLDRMVRDLSRYVRQLEYSLPGENRSALNYTYSFYRKEMLESERVQYRLVVNAYYVAPIVKRLFPRQTLAYSATIGDTEVFGYETGLRGAHCALPSPFSAANTRVFLPKDTPNLAVKERSNGEPTKVLRKIAKACREFASKGVRSLIVVVSNKERDRFLMLCEEEGVQAVSYGNGVTAKDAAIRFKDGEGDVLVGTSANYGEGVDLPRQVAPVIFFLRPGYPSPEDPGTKFQVRRFGKMYWPLTNWRVMQEALQVRGRNVRSAEDLGVTFFISQQFRRFLFSSLPEWLQPAYRGNLSFEESVKEAERLLL